jgi:phage repressor protein C with HTH and peptisase S24 domain
MREQYRTVNGIFPGCATASQAGILPRMKTLADRIQYRLERLGMSARAASLKAGLGPDGVRNVLRGKSASPRGETLRRLAQVLETSVHFLVGLDEDEPLPAELVDDGAAVAGAPPGYAPVPFIAMRAGMGGGGFVESEILGPPKYYEEDLIARELRAKPDDLRAIEVEGQSMEPLLQNRDMVLVDTRKTSVIEPGIFVLFDGDGIVCKWVERVHGASVPRLRIKSENGRFSAYEVLAEEVRVIGRVVWFARRL